MGERRSLSPDPVTHVIYSLMKDLEVVCAKHHVSQFAFVCAIDGIPGQNAAYLTDLQRTSGEMARFLVAAPETMDQLALDLSPAIVTRKK